MSSDDPVALNEAKIEEVLDLLKQYEVICEKLLRKSSLTPRDELEYEAAIQMIEKCEKQLEEMGYFSSEW